MKYVELKDLNQGDDLILAWYDCCTDLWYPFNAYVIKVKNIEFHDPYDKDDIISYVEFHHLKKGKDLFGNKVIEIGVFDSVDECQNWCDFENKINLE